MANLKKTHFFVYHDPYKYTPNCLCIMINHKFSKFFNFRDFILYWTSDPAISQMLSAPDS